MKLQTFEADGFIADTQFKNVLRNIKNNTDCVFIISTREINGDIAVDPNNIKSFAPKFLNFIKKIKKNNNKKIVLFLNSWYKKYKHIFEIPQVDEVVYLDFFLYDTYKKLLIEKKAELVDRYNYNINNRFLFLINKPVGLHRIGLVYKLHQAGLLKHSDYSFAIHNRFTENECKKTMTAFKTKKFKMHRFYKKVKNSLDLEFNTEELQKINHTHYTGIPYNVELFKNCNFQLISETHFDMSIWITEKTWIAIANKRPFIIAAHPGVLKKLKSMGFKTFENYLAVSNYDRIKDNMLRLEAIVENVNYWVNNINKYEQQIIDDTEHNFRQFLKLYKDNQKIIDNFASRYNLSMPLNFLNGYDNYENQIWYKKN
jgi:hypothetical protein